MFRQAFVPATLLAALLPLSSGVTFAGSPITAQDEPTPKAAAAWAAAAEPGPEHQRLDPLVGRWMLAGKYWTAPSTHPQEITGEMFSSGDDFELSGTIGQPDASSAMTGGHFELVGGFWTGAGEEPFCFGDLDGDNDVDLADLAQLLAHYGETSGMTYEDGDLDGDGDVDLTDLAALLAVYGTECP